MDPRFKLQWYGVAKWKLEWISSCRKAVTELWKREYKPKSQEAVFDSTNDEPPKKKSIFDVCEAEMQSLQRSNSDDELRRYLADGVVNPELLKKKIVEGQVVGFDGALGWWKVSLFRKSDITVKFRF